SQVITTSPFPQAVLSARPPHSPKSPVPAVGGNKAAVSSNISAPYNRLAGRANGFEFSIPRARQVAREASFPVPWKKHVEARGQVLDHTAQSVGEPGLRLDDGGSRRGRS